jgi:hypothetical protein
MSLVGRWPSRISVSGNELSWDAVKETVQSQIESAESVDSTDSSEAELKILLDRLIMLQQTGVVPDPQALDGDGKVVGWRDVRDDPALARALAALLS